MEKEEKDYKECVGCGAKAPTSTCPECGAELCSWCGCTGDGHCPHCGEKLA